MIGEIISAAVGALIGTVVTAAALLGNLRTERRAAAQLRTQLGKAGDAEVTLAGMRAHLSGLRHDLRGILSPTLLVADRLLHHEEPGIRRAGEVMVRTVDRATARLAEPNSPAITPDQDVETSAQL